MRYKDVVFRVEGSRVSPTKMVVRTDKFEMTLDKVDGEAPSPIEFILAALAGCINVVGTLVAKDMGIEIEDLSVEVSGVLNPGKLYGYDGDRAGFKEVRAVVRVKGNFDEETLREWLRRVEERCPVSDNLANPTPLKVTAELL